MDSLAKTAAVDPQSSARIGSRYFPGLAGSSKPDALRYIALNSVA